MRFFIQAGNFKEAEKAAYGLFLSHDQWAYVQDPKIIHSIDRGTVQLIQTGSYQSNPNCQEIEDLFKRRRIIVTQYATDHRMKMPEGKTKVQITRDIQDDILRVPLREGEIGYVDEYVSAGGMVYAVVIAPREQTMSLATVQEIKPIP